MSESDDTDILLLNASEVFTESVEIIELNSLQTQVVGNLIDQVSELENRVSLIESVNSSCGNLSIFEASCSMVLDEPEEIQYAAINIEDPSGSGGLVSPSLALITHEISSKTESSIDLNHDETSKSKETLLKEIDDYLKNLDPKGLKVRKAGCSGKGSEKINEKSLNLTEYNMMEEDNPLRTPQFKRYDLPEVDRLLKEMEATQIEIENKLRQREGGYGGKEPFSFVSSRRSFPPSDHAHCSTEKNNEIFSNYSSPMKLSDIEKIKSGDYAKRDAFLVGSSHNSDSDDARKNNVDSKSLISGLRSSIDRKRFVSPRRKLFQSDGFASRKPASGQSSSTNTLASNKTDLYSNLGSGDYLHKTSALPDKARQPLRNNKNEFMSLAGLWKSERDFSEDDSKQLRQKLEEEKIRREHLESIIQDLQKRVLEEQEKLAVAIKVDEGKDRAISQITEAWKQMVNHWREIEADRHAMSQNIIKEKSYIKQKEEEVNKKVERWEKEVSQALDLAAGYKSKYEKLESDLACTIESHNERSTEIEKKLKEMEKELLELHDERRVLTEKLNCTQDEHNKEKRLVELAQKEIASLQDEVKNMEAELDIVKEQRDLLSTRIKEEKAKCSNIEHQKNSLQESLNEAQRKLYEAEESLRHSGEDAEKAKVELKAFYQSQLEAVVKEKLEEFQEQLDRAQAAMKAEISEARQQSTERAVAQQQALFNSHAQEIRKLELKYKEEIRSLEYRLSESERRREQLEAGKKEIAHRLHGVMEAQWQQALNILSSEVSLRQGDDELKSRVPELNENRFYVPDPMDLVSSTDETQNAKDFQQANLIHAKQQDTLLKYIQMLLDKPPGKPLDGASSEFLTDATASGTFEDSFQGHTWNQIITGAPSLLPPDSRPPNSSRKKPPWK